MGSHLLGTFEVEFAGSEHWDFINFKKTVLRRYEQIWQAGIAEHLADFSNVLFCFQVQHNQSLALLGIRDRGNAQANLFVVRAFAEGFGNEETAPSTFGAAPFRGKTTSFAL